MAPHCTGRVGLVQQCLNVLRCGSCVSFYGGRCERYCSRGLGSGCGQVAQSTAMLCRAVLPWCMYMFVLRGPALQACRHGLDSCYSTAALKCQPGSVVTFVEASFT